MSQTKAQLIEGLNVNTSAPADSLVIDSSGNVGLGTSSPSSLLHISGNSAGMLRTDRSTDERNHYALATQGTIRGYIGATSANCFEISDNVGASKVTVTNGGNVGIGTTSPNGLLSLEVNSGRFITFRNATTGTGVADGSYLALSGSDFQINNTEAANTVFFTSDTERARIDSDGRLLVGTSSARTTGKLQVNGGTGGGISVDSQASGITCFGFNSANANGPAAGFYRSRSATIGTNTIVQSSDTVGVLDFRAADGTNYIQTATVRCEVDGTPGANDMPGRLVFSTTADGASSPTERMRIPQDGFTNIYTNTSVGVRTARTSGGQTAFFVNNGASSTLTGTTRFQVMADGDCENTNNAYTGISDIKLKENIVDANSQWDDIKALRVVNYNFKPETGAGTFKQLGLIAQEVETVSPGLVGESADCDAEGNDLGTVTKSVNYSVLYMKAVKALQEAMERIETLEASNVDLLARVTALEA